MPDDEKEVAAAEVSAADERNLRMIQLLLINAQLLADLHAAFLLRDIEQVSMMMSQFVQALKTQYGDANKLIEDTKGMADDLGFKLNTHWFYNDPSKVN